MIFLGRFVYFLGIELGDFFRFRLFSILEIMELWFFVVFLGLFIFVFFGFGLGVDNILLLFLWLDMNFFIYKDRGFVGCGCGRVELS